MLRNVRDGLLNESDWTQQPDVPEETRTKWQSYRQALRDITKHENFPNLLRKIFQLNPHRRKYDREYTSPKAKMER